MNTKCKCQTCGHIISSSGVKLSSIRYRYDVNQIKDIDDIIKSKDRFRNFIKSQYQAFGFVDKFNEDLDILLFSHNGSESIDYIKIWLLSFVNKDSFDEIQLYQYIKAEYSDINETFTEFYNKFVDYASSSNNASSLFNKNRVSRALSALGINTHMKKIICNDKPKSCMIICISNNELSDILYKNGF